MLGRLHFCMFGGSGLTACAGVFSRILVANSLGRQRQCPSLEHSEDWSAVQWKDIVFFQGKGWTGLLTASYKEPCFLSLGSSAAAHRLDTAVKPVLPAEL